MLHVCGWDGGPRNAKGGLVAWVFAQPSSTTTFSGCLLASSPVHSEETFWFVGGVSLNPKDPPTTPPGPAFRVAHPYPTDLYPVVTFKDGGSAAVIRKVEAMPLARGPGPEGGWFGGGRGGCKRGKG